MYYLIHAHDASGKLPDRLAARPAHLERLQSLRDQGRLLSAGPIPGMDSDHLPEAGVVGSLIIAEFDNLEAACEWAAEDPYQQAGVYANVEIQPYLPVF